MDPPGEHEKTKRDKKISFFRRRSKQELTSTTKRGSSSSGSREPPEETADDDSYVNIQPIIDSPGKVALPADVLEQQEKILAESNKKRQQQLQQQQQQEQHPYLQPLALEPSSSSLMRRKSLHKKTPSLSTYQITPITKHYEISRQILAAFDSHWSNHLWVTAYAVGLQFVETALLEIPKHGYFYSKRHERERMENSLEAARVARLLQDLLVEQDRQVVEPDERGLSEPTAGLVPSGDLHRVQKLLNLAMEQVEQASNDQEKADQRHAREEVEEELRSSLEQEDVSTTSDWIVCGETLLNSCSDGIASVLPQRQQHRPDAFGDSRSVVSSTHSIMSLGGDTLTTRATNKSRSLIRGDLPHPGETSGVLIDDDIPVFSMDAPSLVSHRSTVSAQSYQSGNDLMLEKALFLSGLEVSEAVVGGYPSEEQRMPPSYAEAQRLQPKAASAAILELSTLSMLYHEDFDSLQKSRRVRISFADTYQGRLADSTNGCTVIAPLLCVHHLMLSLSDYHYESGGDPGLPDSVIENCIDKETPSVLVPLRKQLGLSEHAFLIPADAHDYLIEDGQLSQDQFHSVRGGNILDDSHLHAFVSGLEQVKDRKIASTLFFHEHVIAIMKLKRTCSDGRVAYWYDVIDSLPLKATYCRMGESAVELCQRLGIFNSLSDAEIAEESEMTSLPKTARIRCLDAEALIAVLRWYACSKFDEENMAYIDQYSWDDAASDFDPRVFQSFVWRGVELEESDNGGYSSLAAL